MSVAGSRHTYPSSTKVHKILNAVLRGNFTARASDATRWSPPALMMASILSPRPRDLLKCMRRSVRARLSW
jgi:hypothetical protein